MKRSKKTGAVPAPAPGETPEMSKLKERSLLDDGALGEMILGWLRGDYMADPIVPAQSLAEARANLLLNFQIELGHDSQLSRWRSWFLKRKELQTQNAFAEFMQTAALPDWSAEKIRNWQLRVLNTVADESRNPSLMLALARELRAGETLALAKSKWVEAQQKKLDAGLAALHEELKGNAKAMQIFRELQEALAAK